MSTARLNVWVTRVGDPCRIDMENQWYVHVLHCDGDILTWCDRRYTNLTTKCGHLEVEIPPGCYMVCATWSANESGQIDPTRLGNHITHLDVVRANCGDEVCVTLFPPTMHHCGIWWLVALHENMQQNALPQEARGYAEEAARAVDALLQQLPPDDFTKRMMQIEEGERPKRTKAKDGKGQK